MTLGSPLFLVGFMGCGKSTLGKKLARKLEVPFLDLDDHIEEREKESIADIINNRGEAVFRLLEAKYLRNLPLKTPIVISCGGGTPIFHGNMALMKESGLVCYLKYPPKTLYQRLQDSDRSTRPLLTQLSDEELLRFIETKLAEREVVYEEAQLIYDFSAQKGGKPLEYILASLEKPCTD